MKPTESEPTLFDTQIESWRELQPKLGDRQRGVLDVIIASPVAIASFEIADKLGVPFHEVTGRIAELKKMGAIKIDGIKMGARGKKVRTYTVIS